MTEREPTEDQQAGMAWWNGLREPDRAAWLAAAGSAVAADAWAAFKATRPKGGGGSASPSNPLRDI